MAVIIGETEKRLSIEDVERIAQEKGIEFFLSQFVELHGVNRAKLVPAAHLREFAEEGAFFAGFAAGEIGQGPHDPDIAAIPDLNSLTILPWQKNIARFACDVYVDGQPWPYCPRTILKRQLEKARAKGYVFNVGIEGEFFLVKRKEGNCAIELADPLDTAEKPCYEQRGLTRNLDFLTNLIRYINELGWDVYQTDHEDANCQFECNFKYSDALTTADRYTFYRYMVSVLAERHGYLATFMPKPFAHLTGSGAHFHMSLWDARTGENLFLDQNDPQGLGLSQLAYNFIGGLKKHALAYIAVTAPSVNSYKRLIRGTTLSGATWTPVYVTYGRNNRTQMLRVPGPGRVEDRTVDASCNPYLGMAVVLAAGLDGIENKLDAGKVNERNMYTVSDAELKEMGVEVLPTNLKEALENLEKDDVIVEALGRDYARTFIDYKMREWTEYHNVVSQWEIDKYLTLYS